MTDITDITDIVARLRRDMMDVSFDDIQTLTREAADEIERLRDCVFRSNEKFIEADDRVVDAKEKIGRLKIELDRRHLRRAAGGWRND